MVVLFLVAELMDSQQKKRVSRGITYEKKDLEFSKIRFQTVLGGMGTRMQNEYG